MTACMYVSPPFDLEKPEGEVVSMLLADTLASFGDLASFPALLPTTFRAEDAAAISRVKLVRKSYIVAEHTAVTFAGDGNKIRRFLDDLAPQIPIWTATTERPARRIGYMAAQSVTKRRSMPPTSGVWPWRSRGSGCFGTRGSFAPSTQRCWGKATDQI